MKRFIVAACILLAAPFLVLAEDTNQQISIPLFQSYVHTLVSNIQSLQEQFTQGNTVTKKHKKSVAAVVALFEPEATTTLNTLAQIVPPSLTRNLSRGATGDDIAALQKFLAQDKDIYPEGLVTGYYGQSTEEAVKRWQKKNDLEVVGIIGPKTIAKFKELNPAGTQGFVVGGAGRSGTILPPTTVNIEARPDVSRAPTVSVPESDGVTLSKKTTAVSISPSSATTTIPGVPIISAVRTINITSSEADITWTTNASSDSEVSYGTENVPVLVNWVGYSNRCDSGGYLTAHCIHLSNLAPSTRYYYTVISLKQNGEWSESGHFQFATLIASTTLDGVDASATTTSTIATASSTVSTLSLTDDSGTGVQKSLQVIYTPGASWATPQKYVFADGGATDVEAKALCLSNASRLFSRYLQPTRYLQPSAEGIHLRCVWGDTEEVYNDIWPTDAKAIQNAAAVFTDSGQRAGMVAFGGSSAASGRDACFIMAAQAFAAPLSQGQLVNIRCLWGDQETYIGHYPIPTPSLTSPAFLPLGTQLPLKIILDATTWSTTYDVISGGTTAIEAKNTCFRNASQLFGPNLESGEGIKLHCVWNSLMAPNDKGLYPDGIEIYNGIWPADATAMHQALQLYEANSDSIDGYVSIKSDTYGGIDADSAKSNCFAWADQDFAYRAGSGKQINFRCVWGGKEIYTGPYPVPAPSDASTTDETTLVSDTSTTDTSVSDQPTEVTPDTSAPLETVAVPDATSTVTTTTGTSTTATSTTNTTATSTPDTVAPSTPTGLSATSTSSTQITLVWTASTDAVGVTGYKIYRGGTLVTSVGSSPVSYVDTGLTANTSYTYTVAAFDAAGNTSPQSSSASAKTSVTPDTTAPVISNVQVKSITTTGATITWNTDEVSDSKASLIGQVNKIFTSATKTKSHSLAAAGLVGGELYSYTVTSVDASGNVQTTSPVTFVTLTPNANTMTSCTDTDSGIDYTKKGSVTVKLNTGGTTRYDDGCTSSFDAIQNKTVSKMAEYYCVGTQWKRTDAQCVASCPTTAPSCTFAELNPQTLVMSVNPVDNLPASVANSHFVTGLYTFFTTLKARLKH